MCTVPLPPGGNPIAVTKYIIYHIYPQQNVTIIKVEESVQILSAILACYRKQWRA